MRISGIQKVSLVDFDGHIACTLFTSGCNFSCPFCHNAGLVKGEYADITQSEIFNYLTERKNVIDSVVISGGEPTIHHDLPDLIEKIKNLGFLVKLDTNGTNLNMLKYLVENKLIDYIAMDIKNSIDNYNLTTGNDNKFNIQETIEYIMNCGIDYEFRTTLVKNFHSEQDILSIAKTIANAKIYYLQKFVDSGNCLKAGLEAVDENTANHYKNLVKKFVKTELRGY